MLLHLLKCCWIRHEAATEGNKARTGGWVRWGDDGEGYRTIAGDDEKPQMLPAIFRDFLDPATAAADIRILGLVPKLGDTAHNDGIEAKDLANLGCRRRIGAVAV